MQHVTCLVFTTTPSAAQAASLARQLIEANLAACVKILASATATYRWQGTIESVNEFPLIIVTRAAHYSAIEHLIKNMHPYALPEILAVDCNNGLPEYLRWVTEVTTQPV